MSIRKIFITALALMLGAGASAQGLNFGVKAGVTANWIPGTYGDLGDDPATNIGFYGGLSATHDFASNLFLQAEALYARKGISTVNPILGKYTRNISYIQVPLMVGVRTYGDHLRVMAGPALAYCLGTTVKSDVYNPASLGSPRDFDLSFVLQTTYLVAENLGVDLKFDFGITPAFKDAAIAGTVDEGRNSSVMIGFSYFFGN